MADRSSAFSPTTLGRPPGRSAATVGARLGDLAGRLSALTDAEHAAAQREAQGDHRLGDDHAGQQPHRLAAGALGRPVHVEGDHHRGDRDQEEDEPLAEHEPDGDEQQHAGSSSTRGEHHHQQAGAELQLAGDVGHRGRRSRWRCRRTCPSATPTRRRRTPRPSVVMNSRQVSRNTAFGKSCATERSRALPSRFHTASAIASSTASIKHARPPACASRRTGRR